LGLAGSVFDLAGCTFANFSIATGNPIGPILAMMDGQMLLITIIMAVSSGLMPHWMQLFGLLFGIAGIAVLSFFRYVR
jgi:hypothetical protein